MNSYRDLTYASSGLFETCARHTSRQTTRALQYLYACDECTRRVVEEALNGRPPIYHGETVDGYCGVCNARRAVTLRQFFSCPVCWNVVVAYQKSIAAADAVTRFLETHVVPNAPGWSVTETEPMTFSPYARSAKTKRQAAEDLQQVDFVVREWGNALFHIELKSGPTSIPTMKEFQLDVNDFNDIVGVVKSTGIPAYIFHVQLEFEYLLPTRRAVEAGIWWTDLVRLRGHLKSIRKRRQEDKRAAYFDPSAFNRADDFFEKEVATRRYATLREGTGEGAVDYLE